MLNITDYLFEHVSPIMEAAGSPTSDSAILFKIGEHKYKWRTKSAAVKDKIDRKYNIHGENYRSGIIAFAKDTSPMPLKNEEEIIHREDWDLDGLIGETEYQLMHPHYWTLTEWIKSSHKRKSDVLTIFECSNSKPYATQSVRDRFYCQWYKAFTDMACISNPGIVPLEYSHFYPYRYDEWDHFAEKPDIAWKYTWVCAARFLSYVKKLGYKHVIVVFQSRHPQAWAEYLVKENIEGCASWLHIVNDERHNDEFIEKSKRKFGNNGLAIQRMVQQDFFIDRYVRLLKDCLDADGKKELERIQDIKNISSKTERQKELEKFNEEHDVHPYDIEHGTKDNFKLLTPENSTTASKVKEYTGWVEKQIEDIDERVEKAKEDKKWHTHRVVFTVLDMLMDKNDGELIKDPDTEYWNMYAAVQKAIKKQDIKQLNSYCYCAQSLVKELGLEEVKKYTNKLGITQFWDERRKYPDK